MLTWRLLWNEPFDLAPPMRLHRYCQRLIGRDLRVSGVLAPSCASPVAGGIRQYRQTRQELPASTSRSLPSRPSRDVMRSREASLSTLNIYKVLLGFSQPNPTESGSHQHNTPVKEKDKGQSCPNLSPG